MKYDQLNQVKKKWNQDKNYKRWADYYKEDTFLGIRLQEREQKALEYLDDLNLGKGSKILELGYGAGVTSAKIYRRGFNITGIDISEDLHGLAVQNCKRVKKRSNKAKFRFLIGNAEKLDFQDNSFDCVIGLGFLHYLQYPMRCLKEVKRVLRPGGYFIISQRNMYGISSLDAPQKWPRNLVYILTNSRYELRWQDTWFIYMGLAVTKIGAVFSKTMKRKYQKLSAHKKRGLVKKNAYSFSRLKRLIEKSGLKIVRSGGAGYLSLTIKTLAPKMAKKLDIYLQKMDDRKKLPGIHKISNCVIFLAQK